MYTGELELLVISTVRASVATSKMDNPPDQIIVYSQGVQSAVSEK